MSRTQTSSTGSKPRTHGSSSLRKTSAPAPSHPAPHPPTQPLYNVQMNAASSVVPSASTLCGPMNVPLNLLAHVIAYLDDDTATLASLCRTSRVLYYMTLPHLWRRVRLRSYKGFRNRDDGRVEGFGGGSPFSMGLNALVTHNVSGLVRELELLGERRREGEEEDASQVGRVSENSMILGIAVRAAVDKCVGMESFKWDLDTRLMSNVFGGLSGLRGLQKLWLRFPGTRSPAPTGELPVLPRLKEFTFTEYDPLCYPDDISRLLEGATGLEVLHMHFSPRMREQGEPSVQMAYFFRRNIASRKKLRLRKIGIWNLFARAEQSEIIKAVDTKGIEEFTSLNSFGPDEGDVGLHGVRTSFLDRSWLEEHDEEKKQMARPKVVRMDQLHRAHLQGFIAGGLVKIYLINARFGKPANGLTDDSVDNSPGEVANESTPMSKLPTPASTPGSSSSKDALKEQYLEYICRYHGATLKHLIFPAKWPLTTQQMAKLIRSCPNLTQLSVAIQDLNMEHMRMIMPFLTKLYAIRLMIPTSLAIKDCPTERGRFEDFVEREDSVHENKLREELVDGDFDNLRYIGMGRKIWEVGGLEEVTVQVPVEDRPPETEQQYREETRVRRQVQRVGLEAVKDVGIWKCDTLDVL